MQNASNTSPQSNAWILFTYISFAAAIVMLAGGVLFLPVDYWVKGYFAMSAVMLVQSCLTLSKAIRDAHESTRFENRVEEARTEKLLREIG